MKFEFTAGTKTELPRADNIKLRVGGKDLLKEFGPINHIEISAQAGELVYWKIGFKKQPENFLFKFKKWAGLL